MCVWMDGCVCVLVGGVCEAGWVVCVWPDGWCAEPVCVCRMGGVCVCAG